MSMSPRTVRLGYIWNMARKMMPNPMLLRCSMVMVSSSPIGGSFSLPVYLRTWSSMSPTTHLLGLVVSSVGGEPARALGDVAPDQEHAQAQDRSDPEGEPPTVEHGHEEPAQEGGAQEAAHRRAAPVAAADGERHLTPDPCGDQLVYGRVDRRVLPAYARLRQEPEKGEAPEIPRESGSDREEQVDAQSDAEEVLRP